MLLLGIVAFNAGMLCKARCVENHKDTRLALTGTAHTQAFCTTHHAAQREAVTEPVRPHGSGTDIKCGCSIDQADIHLALNLNAAANDLAPDDSLGSAVMTVDSVPISLAPVPQDRPPRPLA